jgi:hypothetical protein
MILATAGILINAYLIPSFPWSFRYFLPSLLLLLIALLAAAANSLPHQRVTDFVCLGCVGAQALLINPPNELFLDWNDFDNSRSPIARSVNFHPYFLEDAMIAEYRLDNEPKRIAILSTGPTRPKNIFAGSYAQNRLFLNDTKAGITASVHDNHPDFLVISKTDPVKPATQEQIAIITGAGCQQPKDNNWFIIAKCF